MTLGHVFQLVFVNITASGKLPTQLLKNQNTHNNSIPVTTKRQPLFGNVFFKNSFLSICTRLQSRSQDFGPLTESKSYQIMPSSLSLLLNVFNKP